jgi:predicted P-loop ATPase
VKKGRKTERKERKFTVLGHIQRQGHGLKAYHMHTTPSQSIKHMQIKSTESEDEIGRNFIDRRALSRDTSKNSIQWNTKY